MEGQQIQGASSSRRSPPLRNDGRHSRKHQQKGLLLSAVWLVQPIRLKPVILGVQYVRLGSSEGKPADFDDATYFALMSKHLAPHPNTCIPPVPSDPVSIQVSPGAIMVAIRSFPNGSAGGPDRIKPQHLKDIVQGVNIAEDSPFLCFDRVS